MTSNSYSVGPTVPRRPADLGPITGLREQAVEAVHLEAQVERLNCLYVSPLLGPVDRAKVEKIHGDITRLTAERRRLTKPLIARLDQVLGRLEACVKLAAEYGENSDEYI